MKCSNCGTLIQPNAKFCSHCGKQIHQLDEPGTDTSPMDSDSSTSEVDLATSAPADTELIAIKGPDESYSDTETNSKATGSTSPPLNTSSPITPTKQRHIGRFVGLALVVLVLGAGVVVGWYVWNLHRVGVSVTKSVTTECYSFKTSESLVSAGDGTLCGTSSETFAAMASVQLLPASVTENTIGTLARKDTDQTPEKVQFAGQTAYKITKTDNGMPTAVFYVFDKQSTVRYNDKSFSAYVVTLGSRKDLAAMVDTASGSWQWKTPANNGTSLTGSVPVDDGDTSCYTIAVPSGAKIYEIAPCEIRIQYGPQKLSNLDVNSLIGSGPKLSDYVNDWKRVRSSNFKVVKESDIKVDTYDAHKLVYKYGTGNNSITQVTYFVYTGNTYETKEITNGFEVHGDYNNDDTGEVAAVDAMIASWKHK